MGSRTRRTVSGYVAAGILEICLLGGFVLIAQPQVNQALLGLAEQVFVAVVPRALAAAPQTSLSPSNSLAVNRPAFAADATYVRQIAPSPAEYAGQNYSDGNTVPTYTAIASRPVSPVQPASTQLVSGDWTIATAAGSGTNVHNWGIVSPTPAPSPLPAPAQYRVGYSAPYGTQSPWSAPLGSEWK